MPDKKTNDELLEETHDAVLRISTYLFGPERSNLTRRTICEEQLYLASVSVE